MIFGRLDISGNWVPNEGAAAMRASRAMAADPVTATAFLDREFAPDRVQKRYDWIWDYDARSVAI